MTMIVSVNRGRDILREVTYLISFIGFPEGIGVMVGYFSFGEVSTVDGTCFSH